MRNVSVTLMLLIFCSTFLFAQLDEKLNLRLGVGSALPVESYLLNPVQLLQVPDGVFFDMGGNDPTAFEQFYKSGVAINVGLDYRFNQHLSAIATVGYNTFAFDSDAFASIIGQGIQGALQAAQLTFDPSRLTVEGGRASTITGSVAAKLGLQAGAFSPYVLAGGGMIRVNQTLVNISYIAEQANYYDRISATNNDALFGTAGGGIAISLSDKVQPYVEGGYHLGLTDGDNTLYYSLQVGFNFSMKTD